MSFEGERLSTPRYVVLVPVVDADGTEAAGVRVPDPRASPAAFIRESGMRNRPRCVHYNAADQ